MSIIKELTSVQNPIVKQIAALEEKKYRKELGLFKAEGVRAVSTLLNSPLKCKFLLATADHITFLQESSVKERFIINAAIASKLSSSTTASGVIGIFYTPENKVPQQLSAGLVLAQIADPGNLGTLIRTSVALGYSTIFLVESTDPWSTKAVNSTAGTIGNAIIVQISWTDLVAHKNRPSLCALVVKNGQSPQEIAHQKPLLVVGNEAHGLPDAWQQQCELAMTIPMPGSAESLNASVAGSIALYLMTQKD